MGKALEYLGAARCASIFASMVAVDDKKGNELDLWCCCPLHNEKTPSAHYDATQDLYHCFGCQAGGDLINIYCELNGYDEFEGFRAFLKEFCPERLTDGSGSASRSVPATRKVIRRWEPDAAYIPPEKWQQKAHQIVMECVEELQRRPEVLVLLSEWGIDAATARACRIGWNAKDRFYPVTAMDLPYQSSKNNPKAERKIWWPVGLVFASMRDGLPAKVKIRVAEQKDWMPKYWQVIAGDVPRGYLPPYLIAGDPRWKIWVIVETDRDAYLVWAACRVLFPDLPIGVMAVGAAGARPDAYAAKILRRAELILCATDNDFAGKQAFWDFWKKEFPNARRWPVPPRYGKDVGEAVRPLWLKSAHFPLDDFYNMGIDPFYLDICKWVEAGIPKRVRRAASLRRQSPKPAPAPVKPPAPPPKPKSRIETVMEEVARFPEFFGPFKEFYDLIKGKPVGFYRNEFGGVYVDSIPPQWGQKHDETMRAIWKMWLDHECLQDIIEYYFPDRIKEKA